MCIPPNDDDTKIYFKKMYELCKKFELPELSMGMSGDYNLAVESGATFIELVLKFLVTELNNFYFRVFIY